MKKSVTIVVDKLSSSLAIWTAYKKHIIAISESYDVVLLVEEGTLSNLEEEFLGTSVSISTFSGYSSLIIYLLKARPSRIYLPHILMVSKLAWLKLFGCKLFLWLQGVLPEESYMRNKSEARLKLLSRIEQFALSCLSGVVLVSEKMKEHLMEKYGSENDNYFVLPCLSDLIVNQDVERKPMSFVYVGGAAEWQKIDMIIDTFALIKESYPQASLDFISRDNEKIKSKIQESAHAELLANVRIYSISDRQEMSSALSQYTYGFLFRDDIAVNKVASPIKFLEYLSCGVSPILSDCIGDYSAFAQQEKVGLVVTGLETKPLLKALNEFVPDAKRCTNAYQMFSSRVEPVKSFKKMFS